MKTRLNFNLLVKFAAHAIGEEKMNYLVNSYLGKQQKGDVLEEDRFSYVDQLIRDTGLITQELKTYTDDRIGWKILVNNAQARVFN